MGWDDRKTGEGFVKSLTDDPVHRLAYRHTPNGKHSVLVYKGARPPREATVGRRSVPCYANEDSQAALHDLSSQSALLEVLMRLVTDLKARVPFAAVCVFAHVRGCVCAWLCVVVCAWLCVHVCGCVVLWMSSFVDE